MMKQEIKMKKGHKAEFDRIVKKLTNKRFSMDELKQLNELILAKMYFKIEVERSKKNENKNR